MFRSNCFNQWAASAVLLLVGDVSEGTVEMADGTLRCYVLHCLLLIAVAEWTVSEFPFVEQIVAPAMSGPNAVEGASLFSI